MTWSAIQCGPWTRINWQAKRRLDPYLLWADFCQPGTFSDFVPVAIELKGTTAVEFAQRVKPIPCLIKVPGVYLAPPSALASTRFLTARVSPRLLRFLPLHPQIERVEFSAPVVPGTDPGASVQLPPLSLPAVSQAIVAVIDDGIAFANTRFRGTDASPTGTRFVSFWDQSRELATQPASGLGYGVEHSWKDIDEQLLPGISDEQVYAALGYRQVQRRATHGTHVLDMAAGADPALPGQMKQYLMGVQLPSATVRDTSGVGLSVNLLDGLRYILDRASQGSWNSCPVLVNISYATLAGPHDGSSLLERAMDELIELRNDKPPLTIVLPAGNHRQARCHATLHALKPGATEKLQWKVQPGDATPSFLEIWCDRDSTVDPGRFEVKVQPPQGRPPLTVRHGESAKLELDPDHGPCAVVSYLHRVTRGKGTMILVALNATARTGDGDAVAPSGLWSIEVKNCGADPVDVQAWIQRDEPLNGAPKLARQSRFEDPAYVRWDNVRPPVDKIDTNVASTIRRSATLNALATGERTVVVGAYVGQRLNMSPYSAEGAAGVNPNAVEQADDSSVLRGRLAVGSRSGSRVAMNGTSVAAPQAVRRLAIEPQANQGTRARATIEALAALSDAGLRTPGEGVRPREIYGAGRLVPIAPDLKRKG